MANPVINSWHLQPSVVKEYHRAYVSSQEPTQLSGTMYFEPKMK